jgi:hypothetical protein
MVIQTCNLSTWQVEAGESRVQGHPWLYSEFKTSMGYMRLFLKSEEGGREGRREGGGREGGGREGRQSGEALVFKFRAV